MTIDPLPCSPLSSLIFSLLLAAFRCSLLHFICVPAAMNSATTTFDDMLVDDSIISTPTRSWPETPTVLIHVASRRGPDGACDVSRNTWPEHLA